VTTSGGIKNVGKPRSKWRFQWEKHGKNMGKNMGKTWAIPYNGVFMRNYFL